MNADISISIGISTVFQAKIDQVANYLYIDKINSAALRILTAQPLIWCTNYILLKIDPKFPFAVSGCMVREMEYINNFFDIHPHGVQLFW